MKIVRSVDLSEKKILNLQYKAIADEYKAVELYKDLIDNLKTSLKIINDKKGKEPTENKEVLIDYENKGMFITQLITLIEHILKEERHHIAELIPALKKILDLIGVNSEISIL